MAKSYKLTPTKHPMVFRVVDREGNWKRYLLVNKFYPNYELYLREAEKPQPPQFADIQFGVYLDGVTTVLDTAYAKGAFFTKWVGDHSAEERAAILQAAGEKGDKVHRTIDMLLSSTTEVNGETKPFILERNTEVFNKEQNTEELIQDDEWDCLLAFSSFWDAHEPVVIVSEFTVYNIAFAYAGTGDAILILTKECDVKSCKCKGLAGKVGIWDWKTSKGIRASYGAQVAAYGKADNIEDYLPQDMKLDYAAILRIGTDHITTGGYEMAVFVNNPTSPDDERFKSNNLLQAFSRFQGAKHIFDYEVKPFNLKEVVEIPDSITIVARTYNAQWVVGIDYAVGEDKTVITKHALSSAAKPKKIKNHGSDKASHEAVGSSAETSARKANKKPTNG